MFSSKIKIILGLVVFILLALGAALFFQTIYKTGKQKAEIECKEKEIEIQTQTVEVIKYVYRDNANILLKPNKTFAELLERMKKNEI